MYFSTKGEESALLAEACEATTGGMVVTSLAVGVVGVGGGLVVTGRVGVGLVTGNSEVDLVGIGVVTVVGVDIVVDKYLLVVDNVLVTGLVNCEIVISDVCL